MYMYPIPTGFRDRAISLYSSKIADKKEILRTMFLIRTYLGNWALLEEPPIVQLLKNFPTFYGTRRFNTVFRRALHWSLSWAISIQPTPSHPISLRSILFRVPNLINFLSLRSFIQGIRPGPRLFVYFRNRLIFYSEDLLVPRPTLQAGGPPLVGCTRLLIQYIRVYPPYLEVVSSIRKLRTRHAVVTRDPPNMGCF
jgi:hypothetical protein